MSDEAMESAARKYAEDLWKDPNSSISLFQIEIQRAVLYGMTLAGHKANTSDSWKDHLLNMVALRFRRLSALGSKMVFEQGWLREYESHIALPAQEKQQQQDRQN